MAKGKKKQEELQEAEANEEEEVQEEETPKKGKAKKGNESKMVTIKELAEEFGVEAKDVRAFIRSLGIKAPPTGEAGFGPKAKYEWASNSKELAKIRKAWKDIHSD